MACYEYHFITFPFSRKNKKSGDRSAAVLATSVLHDLGLVSSIDRSKVIDRSEIRREHRKNRKELQLNGDQFDHSGIELLDPFAHLNRVFSWSRLLVPALSRAVLFPWWDPRSGMGSLLNFGL